MLMDSKQFCNVYLTILQIVFREAVQCLIQWKLLLFQTPYAYKPIFDCTIRVSFDDQMNETLRFYDIIWHIKWKENKRFLFSKKVLAVMLYLV